MRPRRGRPNKPLSEYVRTSVWVYGTQQLAGGITFNELERQYIEAKTGVRPKSSSLSRAWKRYANGEQGLADQTSPSCQVAWADRRYPGSRQLYDAFVWDLVNVHHDKGLPAIRNIDVQGRCAASVQEPIKAVDSRITHVGKFPNMGFLSSDIAVGTPHLDALGLLLYQVCNKAPWHPAQENVRLVRKWLNRWAFELPYLEPVHERLFSMLEIQVPRLGDLTGRRGIDPLKSDRQNLADVQVNEREFQKREQQELRVHYPDADVDFLYKYGPLLDEMDSMFASFFERQQASGE